MEKFWVLMVTSAATSVAYKLTKTLIEKLSSRLKAICIEYPCDVCRQLTLQVDTLMLSDREEEKLHQLCDKHKELFEGLDIRDSLLCKPCKDALRLAIEECCDANEVVNASTSEIDRSKECPWCFDAHANDVINSPLSDSEKSMELLMCKRHREKSDKFLNYDRYNPSICTNYNYHTRRAINECCKISSYLRRCQVGLFDEEWPDADYTERSQASTPSSTSSPPPSVFYGRRSILGYKEKDEKELPKPRPPSPPPKPPLPPPPPRPRAPGRQILDYIMENEQTEYDEDDIDALLVR